MNKTDLKNTFEEGQHGFECQKELLDIMRKDFYRPGSTAYVISQKSNQKNLKQNLEIRFNSYYKTADWRVSLEYSDGTKENFPNIGNINVLRSKECAKISLPIQPEDKTKLLTAEQAYVTITLKKYFKK